MRSLLPLIGLFLLLGCSSESSSGGTGGGGGGGGGGPPGPVLGDPREGSYNLGPVEWAGGIPNSCAPYPAQIQSVEGDLLAGTSLTYNGDGSLCDTCIRVDTATGRSTVARVVTTGVTQGEGDVDLSPAAYAALDTGEYPRSMTWQLVTCPEGGNLYYQFQTESNEWWTSLWVRNTRVPVARVEVQSTNHADWYALTRGTDGTLTDAGGFGTGPFTLRVTSIEGGTVTDEFATHTAGALIESSGQL
jgi:expansin